MRRSIVVLLTVAIAFGTFFTALAQPTMLEEFTQSEIDTNWEGDRQFPSGGATSVSAFGRDDVLRIGLDSSQTAPGDFQRTEGLKSVSPTDFGTAVQVDLYVDPDWQNKAVRAGFWAVGSDSAGGRDELYGIIEFVNNVTCPEPDCTNQPNITDHEGWRIWDTDDNVWTNLDTAFSYGEWATLTIELDPVAEEYIYFIDGAEVGTGPGGQHFIQGVFLNSYNYGEDSFPTLSSDSYAAHWENGVAVEGSTYTLCTNLYGGPMVAAINGECGPGQVEVQTTSEEPLTFCIHLYTGAVHYSSTGQCNPAQVPHIVPDDGDLLTCVSIYSGSNRRVFDHSQCTRFEIPNTIEAGQAGQSSSPPGR